MGVVTDEYDIISSVPPARLFKVLVLEVDVIPKIVPQITKSFEIIEGDGGAGTIKKFSPADGSQQKGATHKVDSIDKENFAYCYTMIEGDVLLDKLEKITSETKFVASADGGSILKKKYTYYTKGDAEITEEEIKAGNENAIGLIKAVEAYLLANPDA